MTTDARQDHRTIRRRTRWPTVFTLALLLTLGTSAAPTTAGGQTPTAADALVVRDCFESHGYFAGDPDDFEPAMPDGFSLVTDDNGQGIIVAVTRACDSDLGSATSTLAVVLVHPPAHRAWTGADHAILLSPSMIAEPWVHDLFHTWGITVPRQSPMTIDTHTLLDTAAESRTTADPDFLLTIQGAGGPATLPLANLRTFQMDLWTSEITAAYDSERADVSALSGPATVHFVVEGVGDLPDHGLGHGAIMVSPPVDIVFRPAPDAV